MKNWSKASGANNWGADSSRGEKIVNPSRTAFPQAFADDAVRWRGSKIFLVLGFMFLVTVFCFTGISDLSAVEGRGNITIKVEAENVSHVSDVKTVKYYLPREVLPHNVIDSDGLKLSEESGDGRLSLEKDHVFAPGEVKTFTVVVEDVWHIPVKDVNGYVEEARRLKDLLDKTPYEEIAGVLFQGIVDNARKITRTQGSATTVREHIAVFRENEKNMTAIWQSIDQMREMRGVSEAVIKKDSARKIIETVLLVVSTFAMIIAGVFFMIWVKRLNNPAL